MKNRKRRGVAVSLLLIAAVAVGGLLFLKRYPQHVPEPIREHLGAGRDIDEIRARIEPMLTQQMADQGLAFGAPIFMRIFKEEAELEIWVRKEDRFALFRTYPICNYSGALGPKLREGDRQSPEGFYQVGLDALNPKSSYHLSFNLGFPNRYDRAHDRTGSYLMVHGNCVSVGCYAMTDPAIEEIYVLAEAALRFGQSEFSVHAFPFRMTDARLANEIDHNWYEFWLGLKPGFDAFEKSRNPPKITVRDRQYSLQ